MTASSKDYTPEQWRRATLLHWGSSEAAALKKGNNAVPVLRPDGTRDPELMRAAVKVLANSGAPQDQVRDAARALTHLYNRIDDNPPDSLKGLAGRVRDFSGGADLEDEYAAGDEAAAGTEHEAALAELDRRRVELRAEMASGPEYRLYPADVAEFAAEEGLMIGQGYEVLGSALRGEYRGSAEALRRSTSRTATARHKADREGTGLGTAAVGLSGTATEAGSERVADLAEAYADIHGVSYETALIAVQRGER